MFDKSLNSVTLIGNIGNNISEKETASGKFVNFNLATTRSWKNKQTNERVEDTQWHNITVFGGLAGLCHKFLEKGCKICVQGRLQTRSYTDNEGIKRWVTSIIASEVQLLSKPQQSTSTPSAQPQASNNATPVKADSLEPNYEAIDFDDDIPF